MLPLPENTSYTYDKYLIRLYSQQGNVSEIHERQYISKRSKMPVNSNRRNLDRCIEIISFCQNLNIEARIFRIELPNSQLKEL